MRLLFWLTLPRFWGGERVSRPSGLFLGALLVFALALGLAILWPLAAPAQAAPPTTTTSIKLATQAQTQVDDLTEQAEQVQAELDALDEELTQKTAEYNACFDALQLANSRMSSLRRIVADAQADKAHAEALLAHRIKSVYMSGGRDQLLQLLFLADDLQDFYNRVRLVSTLADQDQQLVTDLKNSSARLDTLLKGVDDQKDQELALRQQLSARSDELQAITDDREQKLAVLQQRVASIIEQERQRQLAQQARLEQERQAKLLAERAAALAAAQAAARVTGQSAAVSGSSAHPRGATFLNAEQIARVARQAGFTGDNLVIAVAVALAESGGNAAAVGDVSIGGSFGLWQVYCVAHPNLIPPWDPDSVAWYDPAQNARWAYKISGGSNWRPWSTYKHGTYLKHMAAAEAAAAGLTAAP
jgi:peptidoglycan hydrolase CwlO-like protein